jgi:hypothetical protein
MLLSGDSGSDGSLCLTGVRVAPMTMWHASTEEELADLSGVLGDAWFDIDRVSHDAIHARSRFRSRKWEWGPMLEEWRDAPKSGLLSRVDARRVDSLV